MFSGSLWLRKPCIPAGSRWPCHLPPFIKQKVQLSYKQEDESVVSMPIKWHTSNFPVCSYQSKCWSSNWHFYCHPARCVISTCLWPFHVNWEWDQHHCQRVREGTKAVYSCTHKYYERYFNKSLIQVGVIYYCQRVIWELSGARAIGTGLHWYGKPDMVR